MGTYRVEQGKDGLEDIYYPNSFKGKVPPQNIPKVTGVKPPANFNPKPLTKVLPAQASAKAVAAVAKPKPAFKYGMQKKPNMNPGKFSNGVGVGP